MRIFTDEQKQWVIKQYRVLSLKDMTAAFNAHFGDSKTVSQLRCFTRNHGIKSGRTGRFEKGCDVWNKGVSFNAGGNSAKTRFKKGHTPANHRPVGAERVDNKDGYVSVKVAEPNEWKLKHILVWEQHHGSLPANHVLWFKDNDRTNCAIDNLMCVSRGENALTNKHGLGKAAPEDKQTVQLIAKLRLKSNERSVSL